MILKGSSDTISPNLKSISLFMLDLRKEKKDTFFTGKPAELHCEFNLSARTPCDGQYYFYAGIYRDDGILCQNFTSVFDSLNKSAIEFPNFVLLPGKYRISAGIWDAQSTGFIWMQNNAYTFQMVFDRKDHGTVYLDHQWSMSGIK